MSTLLHPEGPEPERTYWIRRGIVIAAGIVVVALFAADKARMGDVFYNSVGPRADVAIERWIFETEGDGDE